MDAEALIQALKGKKPGEAKVILDRHAQEMKFSVINAEDAELGGDRVIYVSEHGDDMNDGLSPDTPVRTMGHIREILQPNDTVLFRRGEMFRGTLPTKPGVSFGAYGTGLKPILQGSKRNYADPDIWKQTENPNIYYCTEELDDVGLMHFNPSYQYGGYDELYGTMHIRGVNFFHEFYQLQEDLHFFCDRKINRLYLYSEKGNPGERFFDIEIGEVGDVIRGNDPDVTVDNLWIMHSGSHGVRGENVKRRKITNCVFSWLGGSILDGIVRNGKPVENVRYGNGVEIYGQAEDFTVENNWFYQIYDTPITNQTHTYTEGVVVHKNIRYVNNLMEYFYWGIECYNHPMDREKGIMEDVLIRGNFMRFAGWGWGCGGRAHTAPMLDVGGPITPAKNYVVEYNILYHSLGRLLASWNFKDIQFRHNAYIQRKGASCAIGGTGILWTGDPRDVKRLPLSLFDENAAEFLEREMGQIGPVVICMPPDRM